MFDITPLNSKHQSGKGITEVVYHCLTLEEYETLDSIERLKAANEYEKQLYDFVLLKHDLKGKVTASWLNSDGYYCCIFGPAIRHYKDYIYWVSYGESVSLEGWYCDHEHIDLPHTFREYFEIYGRENTNAALNENPKFTQLFNKLINAALSPHSHIDFAANEFEKLY